MKTTASLLAMSLAATTASAQDVPPQAAAQSETSAETTPASSAAKTITLPVDTLIRVAPVEEISSKKMKEGTTREFRVAEEVRRDGVTVVPLNSPVVGTVTWRTGKGIFGKSAKFEITFTSIDIGGTTYKLAGKHRQEGRGNTAAALLVSGIITGKSAVMLQDQVVEARLAEEIVTTL